MPSAVPASTLPFTARTTFTARPVNSLGRGACPFWARKTPSVVPITSMWAEYDAERYADWSEGMQFGAGLALTAGNDPVFIRDFAQALDDAGFDYLTMAGHILSAEAGRYADRPTPTYAGPFHEPFVLFGYLAASTRRIRFRPNILILPLFPTA